MINVDINDVTANEHIEVNNKGGKQSYIGCAFHMLPASAMLAAAATAKQGADKYGETYGNRNYLKIDKEEHLNHAINHIYNYLNGNTDEDHLAHAIVRLMFAYDMSENGAHYTQNL